MKLSKTKLAKVKELIELRRYLFDEYNSNMGAIREMIKEIEEYYGIKEVDVLLFISMFRAYWFNYYFDEESNIDRFQFNKYISNLEFIRKCNEKAFINDNRTNVSDEETLNEVDVISVFASTVITVMDIYCITKK